MSKVGKSEIRVDAFDKATGRTKYYEDRMPAGALYARIKHATIAHGYVKSIDTSAAASTCRSTASPRRVIPGPWIPAIRTWPTATC